MNKTVITLNAAALAVFAAREATKARITVRDGALFLRPTTRKANTVLTDLNEHNGQGVLEISSKAMTKLDGELTASTFGLAETKYGWLAVTKAGAEGNIENAEVTVSFEAEPEVEAPAAPEAAPADAEATAA